MVPLSAAARGAVVRGVLRGGEGGVQVRGEAAAGLGRGSREGAGAVRAGIEADHGFRHPDAGGDAVHHGDADLPAEFAGQAGERRSGEDHDVGPVLGDGLVAEGQQGGLEVLLHGGDAVEGLVDGADGREPAAEAEAFHAVLVPGPDPVRDGDDGEPVPLQGGGAECGLGDPDDGDVGEFLQRRHPGVPEGGDHDAVDAGAAVARVLGDDFGDGSRRDQGLKAGFDVFDAVPGGPDHEFGSGGGGAEGLRFDQGGDVVADVGVDDKKFHKFFRCRAGSVRLKSSGNCSRYLPMCDADWAAARSGSPLAMAA